MVQVVWSVLLDVFCCIGVLSINMLIEVMESGIVGIILAVNGLLTLGGRCLDWAIVLSDLLSWMWVVFEVVDIGGCAAEGFVCGFERDLLSVSDFGLGDIVWEALSSANIYW